LPVKLGPGNAKLASAILNEILCDDTFKGNGVEEFHSGNRQLIEQQARDVLSNDPALRRLMIHTLWLKWGLDKSYGHSAAIQALENGWAFKEYSSNYPLLTLPEYEKLVADFEKLTATEFANLLTLYTQRKQ
jgi:hypothetical protein